MLIEGVSIFQYNPFLIILFSIFHFHLFSLFPVTSVDLLFYRNLSSALKFSKENNVTG